MPDSGRFVMREPEASEKRSGDTTSAGLQE